MAHSAYNVEIMERLFRRFRHVDPTDESSGIRALSTFNQLIVMRERLQAGLSARLLALKVEMDKNFGTAFLDMETSYLRGERGEARSLCSHRGVAAEPRGLLPRSLVRVRQDEHASSRHRHGVMDIAGHAAL